MTEVGSEAGSAAESEAGGEVGPGPAAGGRRSSLRLELIAMLAIVLVMAVVSLSFTAEWLGQRRHDQQEVERLQSYARQLAVLAAGSFRGGDFERDGLEQLLASSAGLQGVSYEIHRLRSDGALERIASVGVHAGFESLPEPSLELRAAVDESMLDRWNLLIIDEPIPTLDQQRVLLRMIAEHSPWTRSHDWRETLIVAGGVGLLLLVLGGALLELQVLRPMRALGKAVAELGAGKLDVRAPTDGPAELRELAERFNAMTASLREQQQTLETQRQRLERSERLAAIGRVAAGVAHEVGNPLAAIVGYTELLLGDPEQSDDGKDLLRRVAAQTQRIQGIVAQLLEYAKPAPPQRIRFSLLDRAREVVELLRADPRCAGVELELIGDPALAAMADPALVEQILINLVLNGAHAAREDRGEDRGEDRAQQSTSPRVTIRVRSEDPDLTLEVEDNGPGVPEDLRARLFEPFFTTRAAGQGTGLGLAISQGLAERMDGSLSFVSGPAERPGARFRLRLPAS